MNPTTLRHYQNERAKQRAMLAEHYNTPYSGTGRLSGINRGTRFAAAAWDRAKLQTRFDEMEAAGLVRIEREPDQSVGLDDIFGDTYNPDANPDVKPHVMAREKQHELDRIERDGVWGYIAEHWNGREWVEAESIWGMVGDGFDGSDYDLALMRAAIDGAESVRHCPTCGQPVTETH